MTLIEKVTAKSQSLQFHLNYLRGPVTSSNVPTWKIILFNWNCYFRTRGGRKNHLTQNDIYCKHAWVLKTAFIESVRVYLKNFQNLKQARISTVKIQNWQENTYIYFYPQFSTITSLLGPATEEDRESSRSSGSTETFSLDKIVTSPLFLAKKMGRLVQEPAPKMLSPKMMKKQKSM